MSGQKPDLAARDGDICDRIRRARRIGNTRCGVVEGRMSVAEVARAFGLADDGAIYRTIGSVEANAIATHLLHVDLAYGSEMMSVSDAAELWRQFMALFAGQNAGLFTNVEAGFDSWATYSFAPATAATFNMGILVVGTTTAGCLWVEDED